MNLDAVQDKVFEEFGDTRTWCQEQYDNLFARYFEGVPELYGKLTIAEERSKISDEDLEWVLTEVPLQLIAVSEELSNYKLNLECLKIYIKKLKSDTIKNSEAKTVTEKREEAFDEVMEYELLSNAYSSIITRVENQINFSREFIMTAKKIWDSRTKVYEANPVAPIEQLEDYNPYGLKE